MAKKSKSGETGELVTSVVSPGQSFLPALKDLPPITTYFALIAMLFIGVFAYLAITGSPTERLIALLGILTIVLSGTLAVFLLLHAKKARAPFRCPPLGRQFWTARWCSSITTSSSPLPWMLSRTTEPGSRSGMR